MNEHSVTEGQSIQEAIDIAEAGDIINAFDANFFEVMRVTKPLTINFENAMIDGKYELPRGKEVRKDPISGNWFVYEGLVDIISSNVIINGLKAINSLGRTLRIYKGASNNIVRDSVFAHGRGSGILLNHDGANENILENCDVFDMGNFATYSRSAKDLDWAAAISNLGKNNTIRGCRIFENWGEGYIADRGSEGSIIENCKVYDNLALQIYANHSTGVKIVNNKCWFENPEFHRGGKPSFGIVLNNEGNYQGHFTEDVLIEGNTITGCGHNIGIWGSKRPSKNIFVRKNTLVEGFEFAVEIHGNKHENIQFIDNTIFQEDESKIWNIGSQVITDSGNIINPDEEPPPPPEEHEHQEILDRITVLENLLLAIRDLITVALGD